ncbi:hypothetical protein D3C78_1361580 [compost metagenome]
MIEQRRGVVWARAGFRVALEAERCFIGAVNALHRVVKQGFVRDAQFGRQVVFVYRKTMVLRGDHDAVVIQIFYRVVAAVVAKLHLHGFCTAGQSQQLMAEADAEHRDIGCQELLDGGDGVIAWLRVTRAVGQENTVRIHLQDFIRRGLCRHHRQAAAAIHQHTQNVALGAVVIGHHVERQLRGRFGFRQVAFKRPTALLPAVGFLGGNFFRQIHAFQAREGFGLR